MDEREGWRGGLLVGAGLATGSFALAMSFGAFAVLHGWPVWLTVLASAVTFSGSAQFALATALAGGGGVLTAVAGATLINLRFVPMGAATARHLRGGRLRRGLEGQAVVDGSWVAAQRDDGTLDREKLFGATLVQWPAWVVGTACGALLVPSADFARAWGLDVIFPGFFALLLLDALRQRPATIPLAALAAVLAGAACLVVPPGVALLVAALAAVPGLVAPGRVAPGPVRAR
ncbi:AzlC family ABC transporter permease [Kineosporia succinea]|uniref:Branched-subunit amino acid permease n=1 Tax=Kineosporia succinea TaxID=84632 RepID=A0ABT9NVP8_9ACTN|nr:AzlC family ABC transporter permease [Kineosporia succinea]MDP9824503.1 putative branched-subunit amino acid permease [Kineosporia succinea]